MKVLYVEDNQINRLVMERSLRKFAEITLEENGFKAIELIKEHRYDVVLIDLNLADPEIDGFGVLEAIKDNGIEAITAAVTAFTTDEWKEKCLEEGFDLYFPKPIEPDLMWADILRFARVNV